MDQQDGFIRFQQMTPVRCFYGHSSPNGGLTGNEHLFTNESTFRLRHSDGRILISKLKNELYTDPSVQETYRWGDDSTMMWVGIFLNHNTLLKSLMAFQQLSTTLTM